MKYKKQIATGVLTLSLLIGGTSVFAASPQDLGIKSVQKTYQKSNRNLKVKNKGRGSEVGTISAITSSGFTLDVKNLKTKSVSSVDVKTDASTEYSKNGLSAVASDLAVGQKVIVVGEVDKTTNIISAKKVKIATGTLGVRKNKRNVN